MHSGVMEGEERDRDNLLRWRHYGTVPVCNKLTGDEIKTLKQSEKLWIIWQKLSFAPAYLGSVILWVLLGFW
jgi:hypothetical protein